MAKTIMAIGAHLDDAFIGAGGVLLQAARAGCRVVIVTAVSDFSTRWQTKGQEQQTIDELMTLSSAHGFEHHLLGYGYHTVPIDDMDFKRRVADIVADVKPDVTFIHHHEDHWCDHVACAKAGFDAVMFTHGLTEDLTARYCPLVYAMDLTPRQTYAFTPDVFYDVGEVIYDYMELILAVDAIANRKPAEELVKAKYQLLDDAGTSLRLSTHGNLRLADCVRFGDLGGCRFALGFRTVWGDRRGEKLW